MSRSTGPLPTAVLISGGGTNLQAFIDSVATGELPLDLRVVLSNKPGAYGLDRNIRMTILITDAKGKVLYNFPFRQPPVDFPDPAVMGALAEVVGEDRETVEAWINEEWLNETTRRPKVQRVTAKRIIDYMDRNGDGMVSKDEAPGGLKPHFNLVDTNKDGGIDVKEAELIADLVGVTRVIERSNQQNAKSMRMKSTRKASDGKKQ